MVYGNVYGNNKDSKPSVGAQNVRQILVHLVRTLQVIEQRPYRAWCPGHPREHAVFFALILFGEFPLRLWYQVSQLFHGRHACCAKALLQSSILLCRFRDLGCKRWLDRWNTFFFNQRLLGKISIQMAFRSRNKAQDLAKKLNILTRYLYVSSSYEKRKLGLSYISRPVDGITIFNCDEN